MKILKLLLCLFVFNICNVVALAEENYIYLGDVIPDIRLYLKTPDVEKYKSMYEIINQTTGEHVYCIEPGVVLKDGYFTTYQYINMIPDDLGITEEDWNNLRTIAYYGYGYQDRSDIKWYAATQFMIWEYLLEGKGEIYFVNQSNQKIDLLQEEIDTIKKDVERHQMMPSFLENIILKEVNLGDSLTFVDEYGIIKDFAVSGINNYQIDGNKITFTFDAPGHQEIVFYRNLGEMNIPKIFYSPSSQTVMSKGIISRPAGVLEVEVDYPTVTLIKKNVDQTTLSLEGAIYHIYHEDGSHYQTLVTDANGVAFSNMIELGKYYLQEVKAPYGYELNPEKIYFEVIEDDIVIEVEEKAIKKEIVIEKYLENVDGNLQLEKDALFHVYDGNQQLVTTFKTDEYGKYHLVLPYGEYTLKQITSAEGYQLIDDLTLIVDENTSSNLILKNPQIVGSLIIQKKDASSKELIREEAEFKIFNLDTKEYLLLDGKDSFKTEDGVIKITNIPYGNYELEEISAPDGYQLLDERYSFSIKDETEIILEVYNPLQNGSLQIEKLDYETLEPLQGVLFGFYDKDKNLLEEYETDENGIIRISNLLEGLYYIKELATPEGYELLDGFMEVHIKNDVLSTFKITNRMKIEVPKTGVNEFLFTMIFSSACFFLGVILCNYDKNN